MIAKIKLWFLKRIIKDVVRQGYQKRKIVEFYGLVISASRDEYTEDNKPTLDAFLDDCHKQALGLF